MSVPSAPPGDFLHNGYAPRTSLERFNRRLDLGTHADPHTGQTILGTGGVTRTGRDIHVSRTWRMNEWPRPDKRVEEKVGEEVNIHSIAAREPITVAKALSGYFIT